MRKPKFHLERKPLDIIYTSFIRPISGYADLVWCNFTKHQESKKEGKGQESIQSSTTPDLGYQRESDSVTIRHHKREPRGQPFPSR